MNDSIIRDIKIKSPDGIEEIIGVEQIGADTYILLENPLFSCKINYGTVIKALPNDKGELELTQIIRASEYTTRKFLLSTYARDSNFVKNIGDPIIAAGGTWEVAMSGILFIHIAKKSSFDLNNFFKEKNFYPTEITDDI